MTRDVDHAAAFINRINELYRGVAGPQAGRLPEIVHEDGKQFFLDLRPYRAAYQRLDPVGYARSVTEEAEWVAPLFLGGWFLAEPDGGERVAWGPPRAQLVFVNPTDRTRKFDLFFTIGVDTVGPFDVSFGPPINDSFPLDKITDPADPHDLKRHGQHKKYELELPPGRTVIHIRCRPPEYFLPFDSRNLCYFLKDFKLKVAAVACGQQVI